MDAIRSLYRQLVKVLHPDRATSPEDARRRTELMQRANRARDSNDLQALTALQAELTKPTPAPDRPPLPRAADIDIWKLKRAVLTDEGWVCPPCAGL
jgi:hypothetical protein